MTDDLLARAQQALERITPAPWTQVGFGNIHAEPVGDHPPVAKTWNRANGDFIAAARTLIPELIDALTDARDVNMMLRDSIKKLRAENQRLRDQLHAVPSAIRAYAGGELDGYSYHGDGSAIEALRRLSEHAENIRDYAATRQETTDEQ